VALFAWPAVCAFLFVRLPLEKAAIWSLLGGYLLLPSATTVDAALLPPLDKFSIPALSTFLLCWMKGTQSPPPRRSLLIYSLAFLFVVSPIFTTLSNSYELQIGNRSLPGFYPLDGVKTALRNLITLAPFFIGMRFLSSEKSRALLLTSLPIAALFYSLPMLLEIRLSPQLQRWVYGSSSAGFVQQVRGGGFRPVVFLTNGLEVALFVSMAVIAAVVAVRARWRILGLPTRAIVAYLSVLLLFCKTMGAAVYALVMAPLALFMTPRTWARAALAVLLVVTAYPLLRTYDLIPVHHIADAANAISAARSSSFKDRVRNEDMLLSKANEKPLLGWGTWGRSRVFDPNTGQDISVTDGEWIMQFGMFGWLGYLSLFGLFAAAVFRAPTAVRGQITQSTLAIGGMCLLLAANVVDLLPNSDLSPLTYLLAGSIAGCVRVRSARRSKQPLASRPLETVALQH
jgi:hypothetical protein